MGNSAEQNWEATAATSSIRKQCPNCRVTLTRFQWSKLWFMSSVMSGRLVQPCGECGTLLRMSSMTLLTSLGALGLILTAIGLFRSYTPLMLVLALIFTLIILAGVMGTRVEAVPGPSAAGPSTAL